MQLNLTSFLLLNRRLKASQQKDAENKGALSSPDATHNEIANASLTDSTSENHKTRKQRFADWMSPKPEPIKLFPGENEIFRKGLVLVTDKRFAYIDPFDRMLKTYMFEHMISMHKQFYRTSDLNRRLCKGLLAFSVLAFLIILIIDLLDSNSGVFFLVYIPLIASIFIGFKVWNDIKPRYVIHWRMRDLSYDEIVQEPMLRERLMGSKKREVFMNELADAMNQALSAKSSLPERQYHPYERQSDSETSADGTGGETTNTSKPTLKLVTESYQ